MAQGGASVDTDVLIVGAGPTGLALATELRAHSLPFRIVDRAIDGVHESRALAIQARTLEVLDRLGAAADLVAAGDRAATLALHTPHSTTSIPLFEMGASETRYPFLLFLAQSETERLLAAQLSAAGVVIERDLEVTALVQHADSVTCTTVGRSGEPVSIRSRFVVGCDGAHSAVRHSGGVPFVGEAFPQTFALADLDVDGLEPGRVHAFVGAAGFLFFFPLAAPAPWRMLTMLPAGSTSVSLASLQEVADGQAGGGLTLRNPVWLTDFTIQARRAEHFRAGRLLLAGDAAHIHSPAGAQGMNTGIQDAANLGWKLALVCRGLAPAALLDSYDAERTPVARSVLRMTNRAFRVATTANPVVRFLRPRLAATIAPVAFRLPAVRRAGFRVVSELAVRYRRSPIVTEGEPRLWRGPRAGDRMPDLPVRLADRDTSLQQVLNPTRFHLVLCGRIGPGPVAAAVALKERWPALIDWSRLDAGPRPPGGPHPEAWITTRESLAALGADGRATAHYLVRPDGYIGYRARGHDLTALDAYLSALLLPPAAARARHPDP